MKKILLSTITALTLGITQSFAGGFIAPPPMEKEDSNITGLYVGVGVSQAFFDGNCPCDNAVFEDYTYGGLIRIGYDFNQFGGIELRAAKTWMEEEGAMVKSHIGLFAKPQYHISEDLNIYALIGYAKTEIGDHPEVSFDDSGFSWGVGLEFDLFEDEKDENIHYDREFDGMGDQEQGWGLFVDYQKLIEKDGAPDIHLISFGVTYDF